MENDFLTYAIQWRHSSFSIEHFRKTEICERYRPSKIGESFCLLFFPSQTASIVMLTLKKFLKWGERHIKFIKEFMCLQFKY